MNDWIIGLGVTAATTIGVAAFIRFCPKAKLMAWIQPKAESAGKFISNLMVQKVGKKEAESIEEGVIVTLASVLYAAITSFMKGLLSDNEDRQV